MVYVGVDIGKRRCITCIMDERGSILETGSYPNTPLDALQYAKQIVERYPGACKAVVESTGNMRIKTYDAFEANGFEVPHLCFRYNLTYWSLIEWWGRSDLDSSKKRVQSTDSRITYDGTQSNWRACRACLCS